MEYAADNPKDWGTADNRKKLWLNWGEDDNELVLENHISEDRTEKLSFKYLHKSVASVRTAIKLFFTPFLLTGFRVYCSRSLTNQAIGAFLSILAHGMTYQVSY